MTTSAWALLLATPTPSPGTSTAPDPDLVTPGVAGFAVVFFLAVATILLLRSMTGHLRKVRYSPDPVAENQAARPAEPSDDREHPATNGNDRR